MDGSLHQIAIALRDALAEAGLIARRAGGLQVATCFQEVVLSYGDDPEVTGPQQKVMVNSRVLEYETLVSLAQQAAFNRRLTFEHS